MTGIWRIWMTLWCVAVTIFGIVLALGGLETTTGPTQLVFSFLNGPGTLEFDPHMRFSLSVLGAVTIGWSVTLLAAVSAACRLDPQQSKPVWIMIILSVLSWYVIDSILSVATGFWLNTVPNTIYMAAFLLPVMKSGVLKPQLAYQ